jgi:exodeoxyribonuclease V alpha subunit
VDLRAEIRKIIYTNAENGFTVAKMNAYGEIFPITAVGTIFNPIVGVALNMKGAWRVHEKFGRQFKFTDHQPAMPFTPEGISRFLGSGIIKGIGSFLAKQIACKFGEETFDIIEHNPKRLLEIKGIGTKRVLMIIRDWRKHKEIHKIKDFLKQHDLSLGLAEKLYRLYQNKAISFVRTNPYCLCDDTLGVSFISADKIALRMGIGEKHPLRVDAVNFHSKHLKFITNNNENNLLEQKKRMLPHTEGKKEDEFREYINRGL